MRQLSISFIAIMAVSSGCSETSTSGQGECSSNDDCSPGEVCTDGGCITLCTTDFDCDTGTICQDNVCAVGTRADIPEILSIDGVGGVDGAAGHADHLMETHLRIRGNNLEGAQVTLTGQSGGSYTLEVCQASATELEVKPPTDLPPGDYAMTVANQAGDCSTDLSIVQGAAGVAGPAGAEGPEGPEGPAGSPDTGTEIVAKINDSATAGTIDAGRIAPDAMAGGANMIPDPYFEHDMSMYSLRSGAGSVVTVTDAFAGTRVFENDANETPWLFSNAVIPIEATTRYAVKGTFRRTSTAGSAGTVFLAVLLFDGNLDPIAGDGTWWYYAISARELTDTAWHTYSLSFGAGTAHALPADARFMSAGAILNYDGSATAGNRSFQVSGLGLYAGRQQADISWQAIHAAAAAACRGSTATGGSGCCANVVRARNTTSGLSCTTICSNAGETCDGEVSLTGYPVKATANGQQVGSFYNYGCAGSGNGGSEATADVLSLLNDATGYWSFCCCRP